VRTAGLAPRGRGTRFVAWAAREYELEHPHTELVIEAGRLLDRLDALAAALEADGMTVPGSAGQPRPHPLLAEQRQTALALGRLLDRLGLEAPDGPESSTTRRARRAAEARWGVARLADRRSL
jgi:hypothetical protein